jgi:hypothetical protein
MNPVHTPKTYFPKIQFNIVLSDNIYLLLAFDGIKSIKIEYIGIKLKLSSSLNLF